MSDGGGEFYSNSGTWDGWVGASASVEGSAGLSPGRVVGLVLAKGKGEEKCRQGLSRKRLWNF